MNIQRKVAPKGDLSIRKINSNSPFSGRDTSFISALKDINPFQRGLHPEAKKWRMKNLRYTVPGISKVYLTKSAVKLFHIPVMTAYGQLRLEIIKANGERIPLGLASTKVVTDNGVAFIVDGFQNSVELEIMKYHGIGTTNTAENQTDSALVAEITTQYNPDNTRATGSLTEGATANIFRTIGTITVDAAVAAVEHGVFSQAATGGGVLLDRSIFTVVNLANGDSLQATYDLTLTAGS